MKLIKVTQYRVYVTYWHFQGHGFSGECHRQHLPKMPFSSEIMPIYGSPPKTI